MTINTYENRIPFNPSHIRRICLYGGPGTGKSTTSSNLFAYFKRLCVDGERDLQLELIQEYIKTWAWEGRYPQGFDQNYIFAKQQRREEIPLRNGVNHIFTDSPLLLGASYAKRYDVKSWPALIQMAELHEEAYPGLHIFLERGDRPYIDKGRYMDKEEALKMDRFIHGMLDIFIGTDNYVCMNYNDFDGMCNYISDKLHIYPIRNEIK